MFIRRSALIAASGLMLAAGCESNGLSPRETQRGNYSNYLFSLYSDYPVQEANAPQRLMTPSKVAVAQIGEVAPPASFVSSLQKEHALFAQVEPIPGVSGENLPGPRSSDGADAGAAKLQMSRMRSLARDMGMDYLLVFGGTMDSDAHATGLALADLTIVGAFVIPSRQIKAEARAAGALIDLRSGRVVVSASANDQKTDTGSAVSEEQAHAKVLRDLRDEVVMKLSDNFISACKEKSAMNLN